MADLISQFVGNPVNWVLGAVVLYLTLAITTTSSPQTESTPAKHPDIIELRNFTPSELAAFDGRKSRKIYLAVKGRVYDVTAGASFYGPDGMYGNFAGRDASRGLAKNSFDADMVQPLDLPIDELKDLTGDEVKALNEWAQFFHYKYIHIGFLVNQNL